MTINLMRIQAHHHHHTMRHMMRALIWNGFTIIQWLSIVINKLLSLYVQLKPVTFHNESVKPESEGGIGISSQGFESADVRRVFIRKV